ncbi:hypothetical protein F443_20149 [Phytophthora nicotianae P1569]|uniref:Uncharacterized protein n=1 Tax=Phytophthora nicotianae P1569 TaxID=1317065 RepID=V9E247_PHYNI|nr:hypothetical protein F443_20149 [Phytophthora nicotianae P1569]
MIDETLEFEEEERRASGTQTLITQLNAKVYPRLSRKEREALDLKFAAVHKTGAGFSTFEHPAQQSFFLIFSTINGLLRMAAALIKAPSVTLGVDGATNVLSRSMSNVIAPDPHPWFVEYLRAVLKRESAPEVFTKIKDRAV